MAERLTKKTDNQPTKGDFQALVREMVILRQEQRSAVSAIRNRLKKAKGDGFDIKTLGEVLALREQDPEIVAMQMEKKLLYLGWSGIEVGTQLDMFDARPTVDGLTEKERIAETLFTAEQAGYQAGRAGASRTDGNPHTPGSELYDAHDQGWIRGQTHIAREMTPKDAPKPAKPGRKKKAGNPEDGPPKGDEAGAGDEDGTVH